MSRLLPLFPLELVAFPGRAIPLHIFEERYREMVGEAAASGGEFGIVLAKDGGIVNAGCTVLVETVLRRYPDGRFDVMTRGARRFEIRSIDQSLAWLQGEVEFFDDTDASAVAQDLRTRALTAFGQLQGDSGENTPALDPRHPLLSFQLIAAVEDLDFQSLMLRTRSEAQRLRQFIEFTTEYIPRKQYVAKMKTLAPRNGSGHKPGLS